MLWPSVSPYLAPIVFDMGRALATLASMNPPTVSSPSVLAIRQAYLLQLARYRGFRALGYSVLAAYRLSLRQP